MLFKIAFRNILRNARRSLITLLGDRRRRGWRCCCSARFTAYVFHGLQTNDRRSASAI